MDLIPSASVAKKIGRIAQLGERCPYKAEVTGSIPVPPTNEEIQEITGKALPYPLVVMYKSTLYRI